jgi:hypothetical protein
MCPQHDAPDAANAPARESKPASAYILPIQADRLDAGMKHHDHCVSSSEENLESKSRS